jgi:hypothetical protein
MDYTFLRIKEELMAKRKRHKPRKKPFRISPPEPRYPIATVVYYGPDDRTPTKIAVCIVDQHSAIQAIERWAGPDVAQNSEVAAQIHQFIKQHGAKDVIATDDVIGCPHEEGLDYPKGEDCPFCPFGEVSRVPQPISKEICFSEGP